ncbi:MAG: ferritin-like domain-containing protein, partial [Gammaproteobacteria bacterium]|nr:ferritin-like domain-containing protein [Gammaproteobacteria bacterium]
RALSRSASEPVFRELTRRIADQEVSHYKHFYRFFRRYREQERVGRLRVLDILVRRTLELKSEDADCAIRHVIATRHPDRAADAEHIRAASAQMSRTVRTHLSAGTTLKMLMRPLELPARVQAWIQVPVTQFMQHVFLR